MIGCLSSDNVDYWEDVHGFNMNPVAQRVLENKLAGVCASVKAQ